MTTTAKPYKITKNQYGERFVVIGRQIIPADIAGLCAGKDHWISQIQCKCRDCGQLFAFRDLQGNGQWCEPCATADIEE